MLSVNIQNSDCTGTLLSHPLWRVGKQKAGANTDPQSRRDPKPFLEGAAVMSALSAAPGRGLLKIAVFSKWDLTGFESTNLC